MHRAHQLARPNEKGRHYGAITGKDLDVLRALLWRFHNAGDGRCFPSYERLAEAAGCARSHVAGALRRLEAAGLVAWVNRLVRIKERCRDLFGSSTGWRWRVIRTSNSYSFRDPQPQARPVISSKAKFQPGTTSPDPTQPAPQLPGMLAAALARLGHAVADQMDGPSGPKTAPICGA
jgi:DNA-binding transcriptional MocR family regulator